MSDATPEEHAGHHSGQSEHRADVSEARADDAEARADALGERMDVAEGDASANWADISEARADISEARADVAEARADALGERVQVSGDATTQRADTAELQVVTLTEHVGNLTSSLSSVGETLAAEATWRRRFFAAFLGYLVVSLLVGVVLITVGAENRRIGEGNLQIGQDTRRTDEVIADCFDEQGKCYRAARLREADQIDRIDQNGRCLVQDTINDLINNDPNAAERGVQPIDVTPGFDCNADGTIAN